MGKNKKRNWKPINLVTFFSSCISTKHSDFTPYPKQNNINNTTFSPQALPTPRPMSSNVNPFQINSIASSSELVTNQLSGIRTNGSLNEQVRKSNRQIKPIRLFNDPIAWSALKDKKNKPWK